MGIIVSSSDQLRDRVAAAHRAYHTLHDALLALPEDHPAYQGLAELIAFAANHWHDARLALDEARGEARAGHDPPGRS